MRQLFAPACVLAIALHALGQFAPLGPGPCPDSRDGDPCVTRIVGALPGDAEQILEGMARRAGAGGGSGGGGGGGGGGGPRSTGAFVPTGTGTEADGHAKALFTPDGSAVMVANRDSRNVTIFDIATRALVREIPITGSPQSIALSSDGVHAVTANLFESTASIIDISTGDELSVVPVGSYPSAVTITPSGATAVVASGGTATCTVIDIATGTVLRTVPGGSVQTIFSGNPESGATGFRTSGPVMADDTNLVVPDYSNSRVRVVNIWTGAVTDLVSPPNPVGVAVIPGTGRVVVTHYGGARRISIIDAPAKAISTVATTADLDGPIAVNPSGTHAVVAVLNATRVINLSSGAASPDVFTASVSEIYTTADGQYALCTGYYGSLISYATQSLVKQLNQFVSAPIGAVSPVSTRAALFSDVFGEDMVIVSTAGAAGGLLSAGPTGPAPEADKSRTCAVTPDGSKAVVVCQNSQTAVVVDALSRSVLATVNVDRRPGTVAITPDGSRAVVASRDGVNLTVINLANYTKTDIPISTRADEVRVSPDSQFAYAAVVTGGDGVWRVNLSTLAVQGAKLLTGDMGSIGMPYQPFSGIALSHDGATLVTCDSFTNTVSIIDTAAWAVVKTVPVGSFPVSAVFSPNDSRLYVANRDADSISVISVAGAASAVVGLIPVGGAGADQPYQMAVSPDGSRLYAVLYGTQKIAVCNTATLTQLSAITLAPDRTLTAFFINPAGDRLYAALSTTLYTFATGGYTIFQDGVFRVINAATGSTVQNLPVGRGCAFGAIGDFGGRAALANPTGDGVTLVVTGCAPDFDGNSFVNGADFDAFVTAFEAGAQGADYDGNTFVNGADFDQFVIDFEAGC